MERAPAYQLDSDFQFFDANPAQPALDSDFQFFEQSELEKPRAMAEKSKPKEEKPNKLRPKEKVFLARLGAAALATVMLAAPVAKRGAIKTPAATEVEVSSKDASGNIPGTIYDTEGNIIFAPDRAAGSNPVISFQPIIDIVDTSPAMNPVEKPPVAEEIASILPEVPGATRPNAELVATLDAMLAEKFAFADEAATEKPTSTTIETTATVTLPAIEAPIVEAVKKWEGKALNSYDGHVDGPTGDETFYNLPMGGIVDRMHRMGVEGEYWVREDGVKMLGNYVMVAANLAVHPRGSIVETTLGPGIVCDTGSFAKDHPNRLDIATDW